MSLIYGYITSHAVSTDVPLVQRSTVCPLFERSSLNTQTHTHRPQFSSCRTVAEALSYFGIYVQWPSPTAPLLSSPRLQHFSPQQVPDKSPAIAQRNRPTRDVLYNTTSIQCRRAHAWTGQAQKRQYFYCNGIQRSVAFSRVPGGIYRAARDACFASLLPLLWRFEPTSWSRLCLIPTRITSACTMPRTQRVLFSGDYTADKKENVFFSSLISAHRHSYTSRSVTYSK